ncbi:MAG: UDP-N-acetylmuramoyl-L-alanyl-D-glutamate--2,6-diaminopimelate ligase [Vallitalea sp.]|jgi:UDP-N-acetylmuramoyl-L-alanyl-D-glutamate--2,6-diaminopimelate ligase|nr:UDP-N-acetylmuramoyl-L-alanyl-D-glutamate--2,6-diaminopimelate ligase [Vallitalea sp.]
MKLNDLLKQLTYEVVQGDITIEIKHLCWDSRRIAPNSIFIAVENKNVDRHDFILEAINKGSKAIVLQHEVPNIPEDITVVKVKNSRKVMAILANRFYGEPSKHLKLVGITGTNGKTSTTFFMEGIIEYLGKRTGIIGTIKNAVGPSKLNTIKFNPTTPDSMELQSSFTEMISQKVEYAIMEVTSIALAKDRVEGCDFDIGIFTNLSEDHLDEHGTMEAYKKAKMKLFNMCKKGIVNRDDPVGEEIRLNSNCQVTTFGIYHNADFMAKNITYSSDGVIYTLIHKGIEKEVRLNISGEFSVYNSLAAISGCYLLGFELDDIIRGIDNVYYIPGRFELIPNRKGILTIVDYAHSPDGLKNILISARKISSKGRLIVVFGCGGNRDKNKRPIMGKIASRYADYSIITTDNPRDEEPLSIIGDIEKGFIDNRSCYEIISDRKEAIYKALNMANEGDAVVIAGKGHENYQLIKGLSVYFNDAQIVEDYFIRETI